MPFQPESGRVAFGQLQKIPGRGALPPMRLRLAYWLRY
jgi:hypothetical protein